MYSSPDLLQSLLLFGALFRLVAFQVTQKLPYFEYPNEERVASKIQREPLGTVFLSLIVGGATYKDLSFTLEGTSEHVLRHWTPRDFTEVEDS